MSILDVYDEIIRIGNTAPNSLMELSFFSHAKNEGPILVNSYDDGIYGVHDEYRRMSYVIDLPAPARDPDDKDARHDKDFREPTLPPR
ncbi:MAG: hypothetical protein GWN56_14655, partial [Nitrosopumilaceae archaeon]|nr:hypothetical protein [Nitrosopumilaceae archaeon]